MKKGLTAEQQEKFDDLNEKLSNYELSVPVMVADVEFSVLKFDFSRLTGHDIQKIKGIGALENGEIPDEILMPMIVKAAGIKMPEFLSFPAVDFMAIKIMVNAFLLLSVANIVGN